MDVAWQVLELCQKNNTKPSVVTINSVMGAASRSSKMNEQEKLQMGLLLLDKIKQNGMQVRLADVPL